MAVEALMYLSTGVLDTAFDSQVYQVLAGLKSHFRLSHYCFEPHGTWNRTQRGRKEEAARANIPIKSIRALPFLGRISLAIDGRRLRQLLGEQHDESGRTIVHSRGYINGFRALVAISSRRNRYRLITDYRGVSWDELMCDSKSDWRRGINRFRASEALRIERQVGLDSDAITCVSEKFSNWLQERHHIPGSKITVFPSLVNTQLFHFDADIRTAVRREHGFDDRFVCVYCGSMHSWQKSVETIRLFLRIQKRRPESFLLFLTHEIERARMLLSEMMPNASWLALHVPHEEVSGYLCAADLGLLLRDRSPTNLVAMPIKFGEYLCCGLPVIATKGIGDSESHMTKLRVGALLADMEETPGDVGELFLGMERRIQLAAAAEASFGLGKNLERLIKNVYLADI